MHQTQNTRFGKNDIQLISKYVPIYYLYIIYYGFEHQKHHFYHLRLQPLRPSLYKNRLFLSKTVAFLMKNNIFGQFPLIHFFASSLKMAAVVYFICQSTSINFWKNPTKKAWFFRKTRFFRFISSRFFIVKKSLFIVYFCFSLCFLKEIKRNLSIGT